MSDRAPIDPRTTSTAGGTAAAAGIAQVLYYKRCRCIVGVVFLERGEASVEDLAIASLSLVNFSGRRESEMHPGPLAASIAALN